MGLSHIYMRFLIGTEPLKEYQKKHLAFAGIKEDNYIEDGIIDSFDVVAIVNFIEEKFGITIDGDEIILDNFINLNSIKLLIEKYINHG